MSTYVSNLPPAKKCCFQGNVFHIFSYAQLQYLTSCNSRLQRVGVRLPQVTMAKARSSMPARTWKLGVWEAGDPPGFMAKPPTSTN